MKIRTLPEEGEIRTRKIFIWFPKKVGKSVIWLEFYTVIEQYRRVKVQFALNNMFIKYSWVIVQATFYKGKNTRYSFRYDLDENSELYKLNK